VLLKKEQLLTVGEEFWSLLIPPPWPMVVVFPEKLHFITMGEEAALLIPPPYPWAMFPEKRQSVNVGEEFPLNIPPPRL
jgi:hypothetical protein